MFIDVEQGTPRNKSQPLTLVFELSDDVPYGWEMDYMKL